jgi:GNAT superfamily N-acetyltransferase
MKIIEAEGESDYAAARDLIAAYQRWLGVDLEFQGFSKELESLSVMYGPPDGAMLLAEEGGVWVGCVGLRRLGGGDAEMKRMFVLPAYQGKGIGSKLTRNSSRSRVDWATGQSAWTRSPGSIVPCGSTRGQASPGFLPIVTIRTRTLCSWSSG